SVQLLVFSFFFSSRRRHTRSKRDWSSDVCSSDLTDSNLSTVPPVWPSPRPLILATGTPREATSGANTRVVVSPTPPVECLSTLIPEIADKSRCHLIPPSPLLIESVLVRSYLENKWPLIMR